METKSVLIVDEDPAVRRCLQHALSADPRLGVVWEACDGLQAVALAKERHPDVVLIDSRLARMTGLEAAHCVRARQCGVRIVMLSLYEHERDEALACGADAFVTKDAGCAAICSAIFGDEP